MHGVLTGDITDSRSVPTEEWIPVLKEVLKLYGREEKDWEIYRGDSFQLMIVPENALLAAYHIKACMKQFAKLDVRTAIGIGRVAHRATKVTQSNGDALVRSGEAFETLKKQRLQINSEMLINDEAINLMLSLGNLTFDNWSVTVAEVVQQSLRNPSYNQKELAEVMGKSQSSISEALNRGAFEELHKLNNYYQKELKKIC